MSTQYDQIAESYDLSNTIPLRVHVEAHTFFEMLGGVEGKRVLDLACGEGLYSRELMKRGASSVVGVDISEVMVAKAKQAEEELRQGIEYLVHDVASLPELGSFDAVSAVYLLHYAPSRTRLLEMCRSTRAALKPGGTFVTLSANPDFSLDKPNVTAHGLTLKFEPPLKDGDVIEAEVHIGPGIKFETFHWSRATHEWALREAGLVNIEWIAPTVSAEGLEKFGAEHWADYLDNPHLMGIRCRAS